MTESIYFVIFPYVAVIIAVVVGLYRYFTDRFSYSSLSSQFLENRALFWGSVPWHYGIVLILLMHVSNAALPNYFAALNRYLLLPLVLEIIGLALAVLTLFGIVTLLIRRIVSSRIRAVTSIMDWILIVDLLLQVAAGTYIALFYRWGQRGIYIPLPHGYLPLLLLFRSTILLLRFPGSSGFMPSMPLLSLRCFPLPVWYIYSLCRYRICGALIRWLYGTGVPQSNDTIMEER